MKFLELCISYIKPVELLNWLCVELFSLFAMKSIVLDNFMEYMTPLFNRYCGNSTLAAIRADAAGMSPVWKQFRAEDYGETFEDFNEVILRFGFATIFIIAFPLVALLGLVANIVEISNNFLLSV